MSAETDLPEAPKADLPEMLSRISVPFSHVTNYVQERFILAERYYNIQSDVIDRALVKKDTMPGLRPRVSHLIDKNAGSVLEYFLIKELLESSPSFHIENKHLSLEVRAHRGRDHTGHIQLQARDLALEPALALLQEIYYSLSGENISGEKEAWLIRQRIEFGNKTDFKDEEISSFKLAGTVGVPYEGFYEGFFPNTKHALRTYTYHSLDGFGPVAAYCRKHHPDFVEVGVSSVTPPLVSSVTTPLVNLSLKLKRGSPRDFYVTNGRFKANVMDGMDTQGWMIYQVARAIDKYVSADRDKRKGLF